MLNARLEIWFCGPIGTFLFSFPSPIVDRGELWDSWKRQILGRCMRCFQAECPASAKPRPDSSLVALAVAKNLGFHLFFIHLGTMAIGNPLIKDHTKQRMNWCTLRKVGQLDQVCWLWLAVVNVQHLNTPALKLWGSYQQQFGCSNNSVLPARRWWFKQQKTWLLVANTGVWPTANNGAKLVVFAHTYLSMMGPQRLKFVSGIETKRMSGTILLFPQKRYCATSCWDSWG